MHTLMALHSPQYTQRISKWSRWQFVEQSFHLLVYRCKWHKETKLESNQVHSLYRSKLLCIDWTAGQWSEEGVAIW